MKYLILLGDGMADWPLADYCGRTPLEVAATPAIDRVVEMGVTGRFCPIPEGLPAGSDVGNLSCFGYDPRASFRGRAPIEAAQQGIPLAEDEVAFRCNLVTLDDDCMKDFTPGHITTQDAGELIFELHKILSQEFPASFHRGVSYRHTTLIRSSDAASVEDMVELDCTPPHDISGQAWAPHLPKGAGAEMVATMIRRSQELLPGMEVNRRRVSEGLLPATSIWFWGQGKAPAMERYASKFGLSGAVVSAVDLVKGIGVLAGLEVLDVPGATGWIDTDYSAKVAAALTALERHDFAYIHVEAPDETAHQGRADLKIQAIEDFDSKVVAPCLEYMEGLPAYRVFVAPDHVTAIETKTHAGGPVPFALCGTGVEADSFVSYSEKDAAESELYFKLGHVLIGQMLDEKPMLFDGGKSK